MFDIEVLEDGVELDLDPYSKLTMTYTKDGFEELTKDIKINGLLIPIILREGKILDGRHRYKACKLLGVKVKYREVGCIPDEEALDIVISNSINKSTGTDAAKVEAYLLCKAKKLKNKDMAAKFPRLNINYVRKLSFIEKECTKCLEILLRQNQVELFDKESGKLDTYGTIHGVWKVLKSNKELDNKVNEVEVPSAKELEHEYSVEEAAKNKHVENDYWELYHLFKMYGLPFHPSSDISKGLINYLNNKDNV